jgi:arylsulfatase A-like enzyme
MHVHLPIYVPDHLLKASKNGRYGAAVSGVDWATAVILHELKTLGLEDDTLVIFTSDNGSRCRNEGGSNGALRGTKKTTWEGGLRVPCIMRWPGKISAGVVCKELVTALDFYPTLATLTGASLPNDRIIDGKDISPLLSAESEASPRKMFFYYLKNNLEAVRNRKWKLHVRKGKDEIHELYNLETDAGETNNLYDTHPEIVKELMAAMDSCRIDIGDEATGVMGRNTRPAGRVDHPDTLTHFDPEHPYIIAMYDLKDRG